MTAKGRSHRESRAEKPAELSANELFTVLHGSAVCQAEAIEDLGQLMLKLNGNPTVKADALEALADLNQFIAKHRAVVDELRGRFDKGKRSAPDRHKPERVKICKVPGCMEAAYCRGLCIKHYSREVRKRAAAKKGKQ